MNYGYGINVIKVRNKNRWRVTQNGRIVEKSTTQKNAQELAEGMAKWSKRLGLKR